MEYRIVQDKDLESIKWLWGYCFESHQPFFDWYFEKYYQRENTIGGYKEGQILGNLQLIPYEIFLRGKTWKTSYIVGVATSPEGRRGGMVKGLLKESLMELRKRNHYVSLLMPFKAEFYYPYDWQFCYHHIKYQIPLKDLKNLTETWGRFKPIKEINALSINNLEHVYYKFVEDKHGYVLRRERNWQLLLEEHFGEKGFIYLLEQDGNPEGYIMYFMQEKKLLVREMAYTNFFAYKSLLQFLYNHRSQVELAEWNSPFDDGIHFSLPEHKKGITIYPFLMARIVDVEKSLANLSYPVDLEGELALEVEDTMALWNNKTFSLVFSNGQALVEVVDPKEEAIKISIGSLTQLLFGRLGATDLLKMGKLRNIFQANLHLLEKAFPKENNYINEYY